MPRNPTPESFRRVIDERLAMAGRTDDERARNLGTTRPTLDRWRKSGDVKLSVLAKLAHGSGKPLALYFESDPDATNQPAPIDWDRLTTWLDLVTASVEAMRPDDPDPDASAIVKDAVADTGRSPAPSADDAPAAEGLPNPGGRARRARSGR